VPAVVRLFREAFWLRALLLVAVLSVVFVALGQWQYSRHAERAGAAERIRSNYSAPAAPLEQVLPAPGAPLPEREQWRPVRVRGTYLADRAVVVRNRPLGGAPGYEVVVPLRTAGGAVLLVDRGWVPGDATGPDAVPEPPAGDVTVVARLRPSEPGVDREPPPGQALRIDVPRIAAGLGAPTYAAYGVLASETPAPPQSPRALPAPEVDLGINVAYAFQWWGFAVAAYGILLFYAAKEVARRRDGTDADASRDGPHGRTEGRTEGGPDGGVDGTVNGGAPAPRRPSVAALAGAGRRRSRRGEPTDEEWEDAADR
jgi:cytochrome oxidase assembly protein ShyY1